MDKTSLRMVDKSATPDDSAVALWIGNSHNHDLWTSLISYIRETYPGIFNEDWLYGGAKHGWSLHFKKSKSFCTLVPEKDRAIVVIVLGTSERKKTEAILPYLHLTVREQYESAKTYHDGKWLAIPLTDGDIMESIIRLLHIKRKPRP